MSHHSETDRTLGEKFKLWIVPLIAYIIQRFIVFTSRRVDVRREYFDAFINEKKPYLLAVWHASVLFTPILHTNRMIHAMVSASKDGDLIVGVVKYTGNKSIRGSTSRGGARALMQLVKKAREGEVTSIIPDGPRGPALTVQGGIISASQLSGVPILPFYYECTRQWISEKSWDKHRMPKPFTTFVCCYGEPIQVPRQLTPDEFETVRKNVEIALLANRQYCIDKVNELTLT
ncbi:MAG: lysophospholipid acyltransferase family protein [Spirochaetia bacterium]|nr:lysophospholipid acyltransferase family protein [Spirochaetia bacterium]